MLQSWALFILTSIPFLVNLYSEKYRQNDLDKTMVELQKDLNLPKIRVYDFIVVGGGAGGCVVASRLSFAGYNVLLLEAGGTPVPATSVPLFQQSYIANSPSINYVYKSVPQKNAALAYNGILTRTHGKMLGGSTSHNDLNYNRGCPLDFDNWAELSRDESWKYANVLKYFIRAEDYAGPPRNYTLAALPNQHGRGGPMAVEYEDTAYLPYWLQAGREMGYTVADPNGPQRESITPATLYRKNGRRVSTYTAYIEPIESTRRNLKIERYSNVTQVLFDKNKKAYGVTYFRHGFPQIAHASKETILSGGAFGTPLLLFKSGIGPKKVFDAVQIPQIVDLPVGQNLEDHAVISLRVTVNDTKVFPNVWDVLKPSSVQEFFESGQGLVTNYLGLPQLLKVSSVAKSKGENNWPDIQITLDSRFFDKTPANDNNTKEIVFLIAATRPTSRGYVSLNSTAWLNGERNDENLAEIDYNLLNEPSDVDILIEGIKTSLEFIENTKSFKSLGAKLSEIPLSACALHTFRTDEYWKCYIAQRSKSFHTGGTCRMGYGVGDKDAVVDSKLSVIGVSNLRVVDASVMPVVTNSNTGGPTIMIAEKISAKILKDWASHIGR